ncbi:sulfatase-like hydrolase/transferase [Carboxylicivirga caseinilyticus]|uniref:sulfatase-like hydrolase/transferase n=1 Tax=Carboxylicivirga caseinilyticus TaxID=3417572 RepID=UPI003D345175|nr:sulfatase-like hydrolase/transferase [Marinilabiliaceae bacterium A049]
MYKYLFLLLVFCSAVILKAQEKPNIMIIMVDDMGYSDLGCYGGEIQTPNIDKLASDGVRFTQMYNCARCCPTRASLLTGHYPQQAGINAMGVNLNRNAATIAEVLKENGYHTGMTGKWHLSETKALSDAQEHLRWLANQVDHSPFAPVESYPSNRGFEEHWGVIWGVVNFFDPFSLVHNETPIAEVPDDFYMTDFITDKSIELLDQFSQDDQPFFMYVAHTAPHWPLHALPEDIAKYDGNYDDGWEVLRQTRYQNMVNMGILNSETCALPENSSGRSWADCQEKEYESNCMEVHAAMIDRVDQGVGEIIKHLQDIGEYDNTIIFVLSDNGASYERGYPPGFDRPGFTRDGTTIVYNAQNPGPETTWNYIGQAWASAVNTPFRYWKKESYAGGTTTPMIVHWPNGLQGKENTLNRGVAHVIDVLPTCLELAGATYPETINGETTLPPSGKSLMAQLNQTSVNTHDTVFWEHEGGKAVRVNDWKLVSLPNTQWELYDLSSDASEMVNLASEYPQKVFELAELWEQWAIEVGLREAPVNVPVEMVFHYPFDGNVDDASGNANTLQSVNGYDFSAGQHGQSLLLNGTNQYLDLNTENLVNPQSTPFTVCAWVYNTSDYVPGTDSFYEEVILAQKNGSSDGNGRIFTYYRLLSQSGSFNNFLGANANLSSSGSFERNKWIHVALQCDPQSQTVKYYINGEKDIICYTPAFENCTGGFRIGAHKTGDKNFWGGNIDELYLFKGLLSQEEINDVMNDQWSPSTDVTKALESEIIVFPNPADDIITVKGVRCQKLELFSISGSLVLSCYNSNAMNIENVSNGQYILKIYDDNGQSINKKVIVQ